MFGRSRTVADLLVEKLEESGVKRIYGIVGDSLNPVSDAIKRSGKLDWIHVRHEEAGAFAASAEAQLSGSLTVCAGSCGPGGLHLINGLYDAHRAMVPVLALVSHIPSYEIGTQYFQETHPSLIFQECSHYCELVSNAQQMPRVLQIAMQSAVGKRGVSVLILPGDIAAATIDEKTEERFSSPISLNYPKVRPLDGDLQRAAQMIDEAERPVIFGGAGCAESHDEVVQIAQTLKAPVGYAFRGKQFLEYENPYAVGMTGLLGYGAAYDAMQACDLLILLGTDFPYEKFYPTKAKIIQVEIRPEHLGRRCKVDLGLLGDVKETLNALQTIVKPKDDAGFLDKMLEENKDRTENLNIYVEHSGEQDLIRPEFVAAKINELADDNAIISADTGLCNIWMAHYIKAKKDRRLLASYSHGSMANAFSYSIGAACLNGESQVISMSGDGGFAMLMGEMLTVRQLQLPVKTVIFNNGSLGFVDMEMEVAGYEGFQTRLDNPNFAAVAEAMGMKGIRIESPKDVESGLREALAYDGAVFVDVVTDPNAISLPPHIGKDQVFGYGITMSKYILSGEIDKVAKKIRSNYRLSKEAIDDII